MGLLTPEEAHRMKLLHGRLYGAVCDSPDCGRLIPAGGLYVVVKSKTRKDKISRGAGGSSSIPVKIRCLACEDKRLGIDREKQAIKSSKKEIKSEIVPEIRKAVRKLFIKDPTPRTTEEIIFRLRKKSKLREFKKGQMRRTFRAMKQKKELKRSQKKWSLITEVKK